MALGYCWDCTTDGVAHIIRCRLLTGGLTKVTSTDGTAYINALASYLRQNERKLADAAFGRRVPAPTAPSWTTLLTFGIVSSEVALPVKPPLILRFDPHHLYYLLLKFDELGVNGIGSLDVLVDGGVTRPMSIDYGGRNLPLTLGRQRGGPLGMGSDSSDAKSFMSSVSTFSLGSSWWGQTPTARPDVSVDVKYLYSSCTKLPALRIVPFSFTSATSSTTPTVPILSKPIRDFQDCPPPNTTVPLYAFKNLQSLILEDLDPRAFLGWDVLSTQLRSLEIKRSGMEDLAELICDAVVEDFERRQKGRGGVGSERRRRQGLSEESADAPATDPTLDSSPYRIPPPSAWQQLRHLSLSSNSLTFIPTPPLLHLTNLTYLDLSSNLLIAIPLGLSALVSLRALDLSDNMIDSLLGIAKALGNVTVINLSKNRIDNLSGLDRLYGLERLDVRDNRVRESEEIGRIARLPGLKEVWIEGNPFSRSVLEGGEEGYRVKCFNYFAEEGKGGIKIDGTAPGMVERRGIVRRDDVGGVNTLSRRTSEYGLSQARSREAKVVNRRVVTTPSSSRIFAPPSSSSSTLPPSPAATTSPAPSSSHPKPRRRKPQRIVDLDAGLLPYGSAVGSSNGGESSGGGALSDPESAGSPNAGPTRGAALSEVLARDEGRLSSTMGRSGALEVPEVQNGGSTSSLGRHTLKGPRRSQLTSSTFDPPPSTSTSSSTVAAENTGEAFRKKIEALRNEVGESWLSVLGERELAAEKSKAQVAPQKPQVEEDGVKVKVVKSKKKGKKRS